MGNVNNPFFVREDIDNELVRNVLLALLSSLAKVEAQKIAERPKAAWLARRRKELGSADRSLA
jgi:DNA invertase Pin-like site-specific DNA recombinase